MATQQEVFDSLTTEIQRIGAKLDGIRGPGVSNKPDSITINPPPASQVVHALLPVISGLFPVLTTQTGGSAGDTNTACTFTYTVKDYGTSNTLGTGIGLETPRYLKVQMNAATNGTAFWGTSGTGRVIKLMQAFETATQASCT